jgi:hypothetical protein
VFKQPDLDSALRLQETEDEVDGLRHYALDFRRHLFLCSFFLCYFFFPEFK